MKTAKLFLFVICILAWAGMNETFAQWGVNGSNIYNTNAGNVGIGNNSPTTLLHVQKLMTEPTITIQNLGGSGGATYTMMDNISGANWKFKATNSGGFKIRDHANSLDVLVIEPNSLANALYINALGKIGMGISMPNDNLHIVSNDFPFIFLDGTYADGNEGITFMENGSFKGWIFYDGQYDGVRINAEAGTGYRNDIFIKSDGRVCMGTTAAATGYTLSVNGKVVCTEVLVEAFDNWPDYVFGKEYDLMSLKELRQSVKENNHLPGLPSAAEVAEKGILLGNMQAKLLEKVEELTLYTLQQDEQIEQLQQKLESLEKSGLKKNRNRK